jgi:hypothetical protein
VILPLVLYECETWSLKKEHRFRVYEDKVLKRIFGCESRNLRRKWRKMHNEKLPIIPSSSNRIRPRIETMKSSRSSIVCVVNNTIFVVHNSNIGKLWLFRNNYIETNRIVGINIRSFIKCFEYALFPYRRHTTSCIIFERRFKCYKRSYKYSLLYDKFAFLCIQPNNEASYFIAAFYICKAFLSQLS